MKFTVKMNDDGGSTETVEIEANDLDQSYRPRG
jgi:hypothetical protein